LAVNFVERFKHPVVAREVSNLVRSRPREVLHIPEAVEFLVGDRFDGIRRDIRVSKLAHGSNFVNGHEQYLLFWDSVPPVIAATFFESRYHANPIILQYAHRVLAQHPVEVTFFFVPQIVQALRCDELGGSRHAWQLDALMSILSQDMLVILYLIRPGYLSYSATKSYGI
jgi:phosphatidylinositol 4-kinase